MKLRNYFLAMLFLAGFSQAAIAQDEEEEKERKGFQKERLFTGGSISLAFGNNFFLVGGSPVLGYSITHWADLGLVGNYNYTSFRDYNFVYNAKLRQYVYGGGAFTRIFPVRFIFLQAQVERNWIKQKYIPPPNSGMLSEEIKVAGNSFLVGGGYTTGRDPDAGRPYGFLAILFDVSDFRYSPYKDEAGRAIPIIRAGINIPLFQGGGGGIRSGF